MERVARWYDKDKDLKQLFSLLESLDKKYQKIIAHEMLQIIFCELNIDINEEIHSLTYILPEHNKRWYDKDIEIQSSIELIKNLSQEQRHELISRIIETIEQMWIKGNFLK